MISTLFRKLGYGVDVGELESVDSRGGLGWAAPVALVSAAAMVGIAVASVASIAEWKYATAFFWVCFALLAGPAVFRLLWPTAGRTERIVLLNIIGAGFLLARLAASPVVFYGYDEFLHWSSTIDILRGHHLFIANSLLPVSPSYPGLELVVSAFVQLTGLSIHDCGELLVGVLRLLCTSTLFLIFEMISSSSWIGALATLVYMGNSNFYTFLSMYSYETIALNFLLAGILVATIIARRTPTNRWRIGWAGSPLLIALAVSHHLTSWVGAFLLTGAALSAMIRRGWQIASMTAVTACMAIVSIGVWKSISGGVVNTYLEGILGGAANVYVAFLKGTSAGRPLFVSASGTSQPMAYRVIAIASVLLISAGLVVGFFRSLGLRAADSPSGASPSPNVLGMRNNPWAILLTLSAFGFPLSMALRLTGSGWEIGNRMSAFAFLGVGLVIAVGAAKVLIPPRPSRFRVAVLGVCMCVILAGGIIAELPPDLVATNYRSAADGSSVEAMGTATARWTRDWLGEGWRFGSDRTNRLLLATFGVQRVVTKSQDGEEIGESLFDRTLTSNDRNQFRVADVNFLLVDLRLAHSRPLFGFYFDSGEDDELHQAPPLTIDLLKFDSIPNVGRIFDNGYEVIYDVRNLDHAAPLNMVPDSSHDTGKIDSAPWKGRTFRQARRVNFDAASPELVDPRDGDPTSDGGASVAGGVRNRPAVNYDAGVLRHVAK